jgi:hypothetical protein
VDLNLSPGAASGADVFTYPSIRSSPRRICPRKAPSMDEASLAMREPQREALRRWLA